MSRTTFSSDTVIKALRARVCVSAASPGAILGPSRGHLGAISTVSSVSFPLRALCTDGRRLIEAAPTRRKSAAEKSFWFRGGSVGRERAFSKKCSKPKKCTGLDLFFMSPVIVLGERVARNADFCLRFVFESCWFLFGSVAKNATRRTSVLTEY